MTLEAVVEDKSQIPEALLEHYVEADGKFVLDVNGMKSQVDFDNYAAALKKRFTDAGADFAKKNRAGLTRDDVLEVVESALTKFNQSGGVPGDKGTDKGKGTVPNGTDVAARVHDLERNLAAVQKELETAKAERDEAVGRSRSTTIRNVLTQAATAAGADAAGVANLVKLTEGDFETAQDGTVITKLEAGNGVTPNQKPEDYYATVARRAEFRMFWPKSVGAGADSDTGAGGAGAGDLSGANPWTKAGWNLTKQSQLFKSNRQEAERLMGIAGVKLGATQPVR